MNTRELIEQLPKGFLPEVAGDAHAIFQFDISEPCYLSISNGRCEFSLGQSPQPSLTLSANDEVMRQVLTGEINGMVAVMTGRMKTRGNLKLGQSMTSYFDMTALSSTPTANNTKPSLLKRSIATLKQIIGAHPAQAAPSPATDTATLAPTPTAEQGSDSEGFVDRLLYMEAPVDPPGDPRTPHTEWARRRSQNRVELETDRFGENAGTLVYLYGHAEVNACLRNNEDFSSVVLQNMYSSVMGDHILVGMDEPAHAGYRNLVAPALRPKLLKKWEESLIHQVVDELIANMKAKGNKADLVADFTFAYPARVVGKIIGLPQENFAQFQLWAVGILEGVADPDRAAECAQEVRAYLAPFLEARRAAPEEDMISELVHAEIDGKKLSDEEIYSFLLLLLPAGIETTYRALGNLLFHLLDNPSQLEDVRNDRGLIGRAIEETLRMDPPVQLTPRLALREMRLGDTIVPENAIVLPLLGAANRDPEFVEDGERFNIHRANLRHITFGTGVHTCIGLHLARLEIKIAVNKLLDALPGLRFDSDEVVNQDAHIRGKSFRSPTAIPVIWNPD